MAVTEPADGPSKNSTGGDKKMRQEVRKTEDKRGKRGKR